MINICVSLPDTRTCRDPVAARILFVMSMYLSQVYAVLRIVHRLYTFVLPMIICANLFV